MNTSGLLQEDVHGIMNISGLLQETLCIQDSMNSPKIEFIAYI